MIKYCVFNGIVLKWITSRVIANRRDILFERKKTVGAIHNCQHLNECTKHTLSQIPFPPQKVYALTFFKWIICHENDNKNGINCFKCMESMFFPLTPSPKRVCFVNSVRRYQLWTTAIDIRYGYNIAQFCDPYCSQYISHLQEIAYMY